MWKFISKNSPASFRSPFQEKDKGCVLFFSFALLFVCCSSSPPVKGAFSDAPPPPGKVLRSVRFRDGLEKRILVLDPSAVSETDVREVLALSPAPRIFLIHGGIPPSDSLMESFGEFLVGMGYPRDDLRNPRRRSLSYGPYQSSREMVGYVAWYYERTGLRPMVIGHSQGGMQTVQILHELNGEFNHHLAVWNPRTGKPEARDQITDALQGIPRSVVGLQVAYASALAAGGMVRLNPSHLRLLGKLRTIPNTVEDFVGYYIALDLIGGDLMGFGSVNDYKPSGSARVRNVRLPLGSEHFSAPAVRKLAERPETRDWINRYQPGFSLEAQKPLPPDSLNLVYAAEVWHSVKRHWVMELQRLIKARNKLADAEPR